MTEEKPLHVRVAEALGWTEFRECSCKVETAGEAPGGAGGKHVPRYDTDWSATGPLIEKYGFTVGPCAGSGTWYVAYRIRKDGSLAMPRESPFDSVYHNDMPEAKTPLAAVCSLVVALSEAGKLPR